MLVIIIYRYLDFCIDNKGVYDVIIRIFKDCINFIIFCLIKDIWVENF